MAVIGLLESIAPMAAGMLVASTWQGVLLALLASFCLQTARKTTANARFFAWSAVFVSILALPLLFLVAGAQGSSALTTASEPAHRSLVFSASWALGICAIWLLTSLIRGVLLAQSALHLRRISSRSREIVATPALALLLQQASRRPRLCVSADVDQPCAVGFLSPRILLPDWLLAKATAAELEQIVLHEAAHLRRFDDWTNLFQKVALVCFPLNPGLLWVDRRLAREREEACDEQVVRSVADRFEYATCLTNLAEQRMGRRAVALSLGAWQKHSDLRRRIDGILRSDQPISGWKARALTAMFLVGTIAGALKLGSSAQLVSFVEEPARSLQVAQGSASNNLYHEASFRQPKSAARLIPTAYQSSPTGPKNSLAHRASPPRHASDSSTPAMRRVHAEAEEHSWYVVTSWAIVSSPQPSITPTVTLIRQVFPVSALSAAQLQPGWYVVQL